MLKGKIKEKSERTIWAEYRDGFQVELRFLPREELRRIVNRSKTNEWDKRTHQAVERIDDERYAKELSDRAIANWRGLTGKVLRTMMEMEEYPPDSTEEEYSVENARLLVFHAYDFDRWLQHTCTELEMFDAIRRAEETKNWLRTHGRNSGAGPLEQTNGH